MNSVTRPWQKSFKTVCLDTVEPVLQQNGKNSNSQVFDVDIWTGLLLFVGVGEAFLCGNVSYGNSAIDAMKLCAP